MQLGTSKNKTTNSEINQGLWFFYGEARKVTGLWQRGVPGRMNCKQGVGGGSFVMRMELDIFYAAQESWCVQPTFEQIGDVMLYQVFYFLVGFWCKRSTLSILI